MMVSQMGFSKLGQVAWVSGGGPSFVGASAGQAPECSAHTQDMIDEEIKELVERSYRYISYFRHPFMWCKQQWLESWCKQWLGLGKPALL